MVLPFFFPAALILRFAGPEGAKNLAGEVLRLIQIRLTAWSLEKITPASQDNSRHAQIRVPQTQSAFHPHAQRNAFRRRDPRPPSRFFARQNRRLRRSANSSQLCWFTLRSGRVAVQFCPPLVLHSLSVGVQ